MAVAATGKSRFADLNANYHGYRVVDFAEKLPKPNLVVKALLYLGRRFVWFARLTRNSQFTQAKMAHNYHRSIIRFLRASDVPTVVLGRPGPADISDLSDITMGAVLLPWSQHRRNCESRRKQLRNPLRPFDHRTTHENEITRLRGLLQDYAQEREIPIFDSFEDALDTLCASDVRAPVKQQREKQFNPQLCTESTDGS